MRSKSGGGSFIFLIILVAALFLVYSVYSQRSANVTQVTLSELANYVRVGRVTAIRVQGDRLSVTLKDGVEVISHKGTESTIIEQLTELGATPEDLKNIDIAIVQPPDWMTLFSTGGSVLLVVAMVAIGLFMVRQFQGANNQALAFGKSRARMYTSDQPSVTFDDVAGVDLWLIHI